MSIEEWAGNTDTDEVARFCFEFFIYVGSLFDITWRVLEASDQLFVNKAFDINFFVKLMYEVEVDLSVSHLLFRKNHHESFDSRAVAAGEVLQIDVPWKKKIFYVAQ